MLTTHVEDSEGWRRRRRRRRRSCVPRNCHLHNWSGWSTCSVSCGSGTQARTRSIKLNAACGGSCNHHFRETRICSGAPIINCQVGNWTNWSACSASCGSGNQARTRNVTSSASCGGSCNYHLQETRNCSGAPPTNCQVSDWSEWDTCSVTCGTGYQSKYRNVTSIESCGGTCNYNLTESQTCQGLLPKDCEVGNWSAWTTCSAKCGAGTETRTRNITSAAVCSGSCNYDLSETRNCSGGLPTNCRVSKWSQWSRCSVICGIGIKTRKREVTSSAICGGSCNYRLKQIRRCRGHCSCPLYRFGNR